MSITVTPTHPEFVAEISGVDVAQPLSPADRQVIEDAINRYAVVAFRGQTLDDERQVAFAGNFGPIESSALKLRHRDIKHRIESSQVADISNLDGDGNVMKPDARRRLDGLANRLWHTDASFRAVPGGLSMLYAHVIPEQGGNTEFADMRAAYDALPVAKKNELEGLIAEHSIWRSREQLGVELYGVQQQLIRVDNPVRWAEDTALSRALLGQLPSAFGSLCQPPLALHGLASAG